VLKINTNGKSSIVCLHRTFMRKAMAELWAVLQEYEGRGLRRERLFRDRENPLEVYDDVDLTKKFRFPRVTIEHFVREFSPGLQRATNRNQPLTPVQQICAALRYGIAVKYN
jgi:hypothetical protein